MSNIEYLSIQKMKHIKRNGDEEMDKESNCMNAKWSVVNL